MNIILYECNAENMRLNKIPYLVHNRGTVTGTVREGCDVSHPSILIDTTLLDYNQIYQSNYCQINDLGGRWYYVTGRYFERNNLMRLDLSVDVLMSFRYQIAEIGGVVERQEFDFDVSLADDLVPSKLGKKYIREQNTYSFWGYPVDTENIVKLSMDTPCLVVTTLGSRSDIASARNKVPLSTELNNIYFLYTEEYVKKFIDGLVDPSIWESIASMFADRSQCVVNMYYTRFAQQEFLYRDVGLALIQSKASLPLSISVGNVADNKINIISGTNGVGNTNFQQLREDSFVRVILSGTGGTTDNPSPKPISIYNDSTTHRLSFLNYPPYKNVTMFLPYIGYVELDVYQIANSSIYGFYVIYTIDYMTGDIKADIVTYNPFSELQYNDDYSIRAVQSFKGSIAYNIPVGSSNLSQLRQQFAAASVNTAIDLATAGGRYALSMSKVRYDKRFKTKKVPTKQGTKQIAKAGETLREELHTAGSDSNLISFALSARAEYQTQGVAEGDLSMFSCREPFLIITEPNIFYPDNYNHLYGRPSKKYRTVSELSGYTVFNEIRMPAIARATQEELAEIEEYLLTGFISDILT